MISTFSHCEKVLIICELLYHHSPSMCGIDKQLSLNKYILNALTHWRRMNVVTVYRQSLVHNNPQLSVSLLIQRPLQNFQKILKHIFSEYNVQSMTTHPCVIPSPKGYIMVLHDSNALCSIVCYLPCIFLKNRKRSTCQKRQIQKMTLVEKVISLLQVFLNT